jgi:hypothetical protein
VAFRDFTFIVEDLHLTSKFNREITIFAFKQMDRRNFNILCFDDFVAWLNEFATAEKLDLMRQSCVTLSASKFNT